MKDGTEKNIEDVEIGEIVASYNRGIGKVEYEGNLDQLFETDIQKFI